MSAARKSEEDARVKALYYIMQSAEACRCTITRLHISPGSRATSARFVTVLASQSLSPDAEQAGRRRRY